MITNQPPDNNLKSTDEESLELCAHCFPTLAINAWQRFREGKIYPSAVDAAEYTVQPNGEATYTFTVTVPARFLLFTHSPTECVGCGRKLRP